jgi:REP element-mobilizing transposase RayT
MMVEQGGGITEPVGATRASPARLPVRKQTRLGQELYTGVGCFYATICIDRRRNLLGTVADGAVRLSAAGALLTTLINSIPAHRENWQLDSYIVMPNHLHLLLWHQLISGAAQLPTSNTRHLQRESLSTVIGSFKSAASRELRASGLIGKEPLFQRGFYDRIVRDDHDLQRIREYILTNPAAWEYDYLNPNRIGVDAFQLWLEAKEQDAVTAYRFTGDARVAPTVVQHD